MLNKNLGRLIVLSAPSGTGKTTLSERLTKELPNLIRSISSTTRKMREDEADGIDYIFITKTQFEKGIQEGEFLEFANVYGDYYGTSKKWVNKRLAEGKDVLLVIDTQGALKLKETEEVLLIFLTPPSLEELERRLRGRKSNSEEQVKKRLNWAKRELQKADQYDFQVVNDDLDVAYQELKNIIGESHD